MAPKNGTGYTDFGFKKQLTYDQKNPNGLEAGAMKRAALDDGAFFPKASTQKTSKTRE